MPEHVRSRDECVSARLECLPDGLVVDAAVHDDPDVVGFGQLLDLLNFCEGAQLQELRVSDERKRRALASSFTLRQTTHLNLLLSEAGLHGQNVDDVNKSRRELLGNRTGGRLRRQANPAAHSAAPYRLAADSQLVPSLLAERLELDDEAVAAAHSHDVDVVPGALDNQMHVEGQLRTTPNRPDHGGSKSERVRVGNFDAVEDVAVEVDDVRELAP